jgi:hypothetical protein
MRRYSVLSGVALRLYHYNEGVAGSNPAPPTKQNSRRTRFRRITRKMGLAGNTPEVATTGGPHHEEDANGVRSDASRITTSTVSPTAATAPPPRTLAVRSAKWLNPPPVCSRSGR